VNVFPSVTFVVGTVVYYCVLLTHCLTTQISNKTRWLYCVECPQYSTRRRSASNIHRSGILCKNR